MTSKPIHFFGLVIKDAVIICVSQVAKSATASLTGYQRENVNVHLFSIGSNGDTATLEQNME